MISVVDDRFHDLQRRLGLIPRHGGLGVTRRAVFWAVTCWVPVFVSASATGNVGPSVDGESLLTHFAVNVRLLVALPLLIVAEGVAHRVTSCFIGELAQTGAIPDGQQARLDALVARARRIRRAVWPWLGLLALAVAWSVQPFDGSRPHELKWASTTESTLGFGAWWYLLVAKPVYVFFVLIWLWRSVQLTITCWGLAHLDLALVATHPDRAAGLGEVERLPAAFSLVAFAISATAAAGWAHDVLYHGLSLRSIAPSAAVLLTVMLAIFVAPLLAFMVPMARLKRQATLEYSGVVARHGRWVYQRCVQPAEADAGAIGEDLGSLADVHVSYEAVRRMRIVPIGTRAVAAILVPAVIPMIVVVALQVPLVEVAQRLLGAVL